jgi:hypothetical protein
MSNKTSPAAAASSAAQAVSQQGYQLPAGFEEVGLDRFMYNPNKGCTGPLQGYLLGLVAMPPIQRGKEKDGTPIMQDWNCLLVRTTAATKGIDREQKVVDVPAGRDVLTPATFRLNDTFERAATDPAFCYEVFVLPQSKIDIGGGQTMWLYKMGANKGTKKARAEFGVAGILPGAAAVKALPQGMSQAAEAVAAGTADAAPIPF